MQSLTRGRYRARPATCAADIDAALTLRALAFHDDPDRSDRDNYDARCTHVLIEQVADSRPVACFRLLELAGGAAIHASYAAQFYELSALEAFEGPMIELGRFCLAPGVRDPDVLRLAWGAITAEVDARGARLLFGCASFRGTETAAHADALALLKARHLGPRRWLPRIKAPEIFRFAARLRRKPDLRKGMAVMPPLLRSYLALGGWVSDHAVIDRQMNTLHVFTGVEIRSIPPARQRLLRGVAG